MAFQTSAFSNGYDSKVKKNFTGIFDYLLKNISGKYLRIGKMHLKMYLKILDLKSALCVATLYNGFSLSRGLAIPRDKTVM